MNVKTNSSTQGFWWKLFLRFSEIVSVLSLFAFLALKLGFLERFPHYAGHLFSKATQDQLISFDADLLLFPLVAGMFGSSFFINEILLPFVHYKSQDLLYAILSTICFLGSLIFYRKFSIYSIEDWRPVFEKYAILKFCFSWVWVQKYFSYLLNLLLLALGVLFLSWTTFFKNAIYLPMQQSFHELRFFSWPDYVLIFRFVIAICIFTTFVSLLIFGLDWVASHLISHILPGN